MTQYEVLTTQSETRETVEASYYVMEESGFVTFKDDAHKQVASYNALNVVSVTKTRIVQRNKQGSEAGIRERFVEQVAADIRDYMPRDTEGKLVDWAARQVVATIVPAVLRKAAERVALLDGEAADTLAQDAQEFESGGDW